MPTPTLQELADHLAGRLQRSVTVVDPEIRILCASAHFGDEDDARVRAILQRVAVPDVYRHIQAQGVRQWTMAGHVPAARELGFKQRLVIPIRRGANLLALLMIIEEAGHELSPAEPEAATQATHLMAGVLDREHHDAEPPRRRSAAGRPSRCPHPSVGSSLCSRRLSQQRSGGRGSRPSSLRSG